MKQTILFSLIILLSLLFTACGKDFLTEDLENIQASEVISLPETPVSSESTTPTPPVTLTSVPTKTAPPITEPVPSDQNTAEAGNSDDKALPMMNVPTFGYYTLPENSPPLFSKDCLIMEASVSCSSSALREWLNEMIGDADTNLKPGEFSIQYIVFEIDKNGSVFNARHVGSDGNTLCWPCAETALNTIKEMPKWVPAMKDGIPVNAALKLPVRFEVMQS